MEFPAPASRLQTSREIYEAEKQIDLRPRAWVGQEKKGEKKTASVLMKGRESLLLHSQVYQSGAMWKINELKAGLWTSRTGSVSLLWNRQLRPDTVTDMTADNLGGSFQAATRNNTPRFSNACANDVFYKARSFVLSTVATRITAN